MTKTKYLLAIDIGNSSISYGFFKSGRLIRFWYGKDDIIPKIVQFINKCGVNSYNHQVIVSSVNPERLKQVTKRLPIKPLVIGRDIQVKISHKYFNINKLGKDRLVNLYGASQFYKGPIVLLSFGTALTVDILSKNKVFLGGLIIPGVETSLRALEVKAALLPKNISLQSVKKALIGKSTKECMALGILQGFGAMVDGLIERFQEQYGKDIKIIACGGHAALIRPFVELPMQIDQTHTLKSLALIYQKEI